MTERANRKAPTWVLKIGGVTVGSRDRLLRVLQQVEKHRRQNRRIVLVVSAPAGATRLLRELVAFLKENANFHPISPQETVEDIIARFRALYSEWIHRLSVDGVRDQIHELINGALGVAMGAATRHSWHPYLADQLVAPGEQLAVDVVAAFFRARSPQLAVQVVPLWKEGMLTDDTFGSAQPILDETDQALRRALLSVIEGGSVAIVPGFVGHTRDGRVTTLGKGGSDYTATLIARALAATTVEIWKEFQLHTADPKVVAHAPPVPALSRLQANELAVNELGALHPAAMEPLHGTDIVVCVRNIDNPTAKGTRINPVSGSLRPAGVTLARDHSLLTMESGAMVDRTGFVRDAATELDGHGLSIDVTASGRTRFSLSTQGRSDDVGEAVKEIARRSSVSHEPKCATVTVVGGTRGLDPSTLAAILKAMRGIRILSFSMAGTGCSSPHGADPPSCQLVVRDQDGEKAVRAIHDALYGKPKPPRRPPTRHQH